MRLEIVALIALLGLPSTTSGQHPVGESPAPDRSTLDDRRGTLDDRRSTIDAGRSTIDAGRSTMIAARQPSRDPLPTWAIPPLIGPPSIGLALPPIGAPLPSIGLQPRIDRDRPAGRHWRQPVVVWPPMVYVVAQAAPPIAPHATPAPSVADKRPATGTLNLDVQPGTAQVFIDGYYVGTPDDFNTGRGELVVGAGPHSVELNASGYETVSFDVRISPNQSIVYRRVLNPIEITPPPAASISTTPRPVYVIPGCYLGNVPPSEAGLPPTCDLSRAITFFPR